MNVAVSYRLPVPPPVFCPSRSKAHIAFHAGLFAAAFALVWTCRLSANPSLQRWSIPVPFATPLDLPIAFAALFAAVWLHEMGHLLAAMLLGFDFLGASLGPLTVQTLHRKWKWTFSLKRSFSGSVSAVPCGMWHWRERMLAVVAAGPLATLASVIFIAALAPTTAHAQLFQLTFVQVSDLIFLLGLVPNSALSSRRNDARLLLDLLRRNRGCYEMELYLLQTQQLLNGYRPQDCPPDLLLQLANWQGRPEAELAFAETIVRWAADSDEHEIARAWDARALKLAQHCDVRQRNNALALSACLDVIWADDTESACLKFQRVEHATLFPPCLEHLSRAAEHVARGRCHNALAQIIRAQYALPRGVPAYGFERGLIDRLHMQAMRRARQRPADRSAKYVAASV